MQETDAGVRLDKWLWAARFFKTRSLATKAINGGKIQLDGARVKAGRLIKTGDVVRIRKDQVEFTVQVAALSDRRGPASVARTLYQETAESIQAREQYATQRKLLNQSLVAPRHRPDKKQRRTLLKTKRQSP
ncbi:MAG: RNA-binding protein [Gammaproteobacteria bacterium]|nr:MAG: RNA-binding protein [Gammaproteobacteria bacterium]